ncbi:MAG: AMP-binding protein [Alteromonadaceae bacterium]|nr:AMP-binding protein [Alteromonadaceae bacterium]
MTKPWFKNYPDNVAHEVDTHYYDSMLDLFNQSVVKYKKTTAFSNFERELSFNDVDRLSKDFAAYLQTQLHIKKGERVALMCPNTLCFPIAMWGII